MSTHHSKRIEMKMQRMWILSAGMTLLAGILLGQGAHPAPTFEVASIKPAPPFSLENMQSGSASCCQHHGFPGQFPVRIPERSACLCFPGQALSNLRPELDTRWALGYCR